MSCLGPLTLLSSFDHVRDGLHRTVHDIETNLLFRTEEDCLWCTLYSVPKVRTVWKYQSVAVVSIALYGICIFPPILGKIFTVISDIANIFDMSEHTHGDYDLLFQLLLSKSNDFCKSTRYLASRFKNANGQNTPRFLSWFQHRVRIHDISLRIRIRIRGSMPLSNGSGFGSGSCYFCHWLSRRQ